MDDIESMFDSYDFDCLVGLLSRFYLLSFLNQSRLSLVPTKCSDANNRMLMRCWVLQYDLEVDNEQ
jgi:hypothetical protein